MLDPEKKPVFDVEKSLLPICLKKENGQKIRMTETGKGKNETEGLR